MQNFFRPNSQQSLVKYLQKEEILKTPSLIWAFKKIDRKDFVPSGMESYAYYDEPLPIGYGQTISQPTVVAFMLELLSPKAGQKI